VASADGVKTSVRLTSAMVSDASATQEDKPAAHRKPAKASDLSEHLAELGRKGGAR